LILANALKGVETLDLAGQLAELRRQVEEGKNGHGNPVPRSNAPEGGAGPPGDGDEPAAGTAAPGPRPADGAGRDAARPVAAGPAPPRLAPDAPPVLPPGG